MATHDYALISNYPARLLKCDGGRLLDSNREDVQLDSKQLH
jgi:cell division transport system ATP-binding protein